jgi:dTDP-4-amino-4,6-dideoxygalactose transaminase
MTDSRLAAGSANGSVNVMVNRTAIPAAKVLIGDEERAAVDRVLRSGMLAQGPEVAAFEREFATELVDGLSCVAVNSGTSGQHLGLHAAGVGAGQEVIVPSFTFAATANSVALTGATPVFADIDPVTYTIDPGAVEAAITERTVGVMPVHLYGQPADMTALDEIARRRGIQIYEDAAQAHGATWQGRPVGTFGVFAMFSLYPTKNMTSGEGGMVSCATEDVARMIRLLRNQGMERRYENEVVGYNNRMTDLHAAIGRVQLTKLAGWTKQRQENAAFFDANLRGVDVPAVAPGATHVYHQYTIRVPDDRDGFAAALQAEYGVGSGVYYPIPNHRLPSFGLTLDLPETERAAAEVLSLPVHPSLTQPDLDRIVEAVNTLARAGA